MLRLYSESTTGTNWRQWISDLPVGRWSIHYSGNNLISGSSLSSLITVLITELYRNCATQQFPSPPMREVQCLLGGLLRLEFCYWPRCGIRKYKNWILGAPSKKNLAKYPCISLPTGDVCIRDFPLSSIACACWYSTFKRCCRSHSFGHLQKLTV